MTRPWIIWLLSLCCAAGILGAMAVITHRSLRVEQEGVQARADAALQERLRLALWRMETEASALMIEENNRPPEHFHALGGGEPSPLAVMVPKHVRLHFEIGSDGVIDSPQVAKANDPQSQAAEDQLQKLRTLLARSPSVGWYSTVMQPAPAKPAPQKTAESQIIPIKTISNAHILDAAAQNKGPFDQPVVPAANDIPTDLAVALNGGAVKEEAAKSPPLAESMKQQLFNTLEANRRAQVYAKNVEDKNYLQSVPFTGRGATSSSASPFGPSSSASPSRTPAPSSSANAGQATISPSQTVTVQGTLEVQGQGGTMPNTAAIPTPQPAQEVTAPHAPMSPPPAPVQAVAEAQTGMAATPAPAPVPAPAAPTNEGEARQEVPGATQGVITVARPEVVQQRVTPFRPFWLENELFLVREVLEAGTRHVQGVWLDAASLKASLLEAVADILPAADLAAVATVAFVPASAGNLVPAPTAGVGDPMNLVGLPWRLVAGEDAYISPQGWTPLRLTLAAAWVAALLAVLAAAGLLFGVTRLSERRAAFVSSVTHELRTPLTTFRLYSELLEQGMVREESDRAQYLHTLRTEAERLTHLVDNVLAYSRIERTKRRNRLERVELVPWIERASTRFEDRTREAGMSLEVETPLKTDDLVCITDATALEQIVFNLVDNACKYAAGRCEEPVVHIDLKRRGRWAEISVSDSGPGIARGERGRLFRPFHKSADEAANSKPGVGLGLALCHRLAKALGGRLTLERPIREQGGACFVLRVPAA